MIDLVNSESFDNEVLGSNQPVLVDFFADWCNPCNKAAPIIEELSKEFKHIKFCKINIDDCTNIANRYGVLSIPTFILFENGEESERIIGLYSKEDFEIILQKF